VSDTINIPKVGPVKKTYAYVGVGGVAAFVLWRYWSAAQASSATPSEYQPDTSSVTQAGDAPLTSDRTGNTTDTTGTDGLITTNDQWTQRAVELLGVAGWDDRTVLTALGKWLNRQPLTDSEGLIVRAATAITGQPPVGGPYPINLVAGGHETPATAQVPPAPAGLTVNTIHGTNVILAWQPVAGAVGYQIDMSNRPGHTLGQTSSYRWSGLTPEKRYTVRIRARNSKGYGPWSPTVGFTTGKKGT
jgi:fibronectin type III domain protein